MKKEIANKLSLFLQYSGEEIPSIEKTFIGSQPIPQELKKQEPKK